MPHRRYLNGQPTTTALSPSIILQTLTVVITVAVVAGGAFWTMGVGPVIRDIDELKRADHRTQKEYAAEFIRLRAEVQATYLPRAESREYRERMADALLRVQQDFQKVDGEIKTVLAGTVIKSDHTNLQRQVDDLKRQIGDLYPLSKVLEDLNKRIDSIRMDLRANNGKTGG